MRISGGRARGIELQVPKGDRVRPATDGMRQAAFSSLAAVVPGAWFLDLFAGSGAYGLEAFSRGAAGGCFVERDTRAVACIRQNIAAVVRSTGAGAAADLAVRPGDALAAVGAWSGPVPDLVFIDPPYEIIPEVAPALFERLGVVLAPKPGAIVVFEHPGELELHPVGWTRLKRLGKGARQPTVGFYRRAPAGAEG